MSALSTLRLVVLVVLTAALLGTFALLAFSAGAAADAHHAHDDDHEYNRSEYDDDHDDDREYNRSRYDDDREYNRSRYGHTSDVGFSVHVTSELVTVSVDENTESTVQVTTEAVAGAYDHEGSYELEPGESTELPAPEESATLRVTAETESTTATVTVRFEERTVGCGEATLDVLAPVETTYEWEMATENGEYSRERTVKYPDLDCPEPPQQTPPEDPADETEERYNETRERGWGAYEQARAAVWDTYGAVREQVWSAYDELRGRDPGDEGNESEGSVDDARSFGDRVREDAEGDAERVREDAENDAERVRDDLGADRQRVEDDLEDDIDDAKPDGGDGGPPTGDGEAVAVDAGGDGERDGDRLTADGSAQAGIDTAGVEAGAAVRVTGSVRVGPR